MDDFRTIGERLSNWGRWGPEDERGTLNHITPERVAAAAALVRRGAIFDLGIPLGAAGPQAGHGRVNPIHLMSVVDGVEVDRDGTTGAMHYNDDYVVMPLQAATQWDGLAHVFYDERLYNGFPASSVSTAGAARDGIDKIARGVAGRGVLLDVARHRGVDWLDAGDEVTPDELDAVAASAGVEVGPGDIVLLRTGWLARLRAERSRRAFFAGEPGPGVACAQWLADREVAALATDNHAVEVLPNDHPGTSYPLHLVAIRDMGMTLGEFFDLEELAADCAADGVFEMFLCAPPLKVQGAVGSPLNPLAIK